jgi:hypothetical protein
MGPAWGPVLTSIGKTLFTIQVGVYQPDIDRDETLFVVLRGLFIRDGENP